MKHLLYQIRSLRSRLVYELIARDLNESFVNSSTNATAQAAYCQ